MRVPEDPAGPADARAADLLPDRPAGDEGPRRHLELLPRLNVRA
ncbi:hypothetical protein ACFXPI_21870 [Streptomyces sp. NPDC059104]